MNKVIVAMLSGGAGSTYMLHKLLTETRYPVLIHHISNRYPSEPRWEKEDQATENIITYFRENYRNFTYFTSRYDFLDHPNTHNHNILDKFIDDRIRNNESYDTVEIANGCTSVNRLHQKEENKNQSLIENYARKTREILTDCMNDVDRMRIIWTPSQPLIKLTKYDILKNLPSELLALTWSCHRPKNGHPCNICRSCQDINRVLSPLKFKPTSTKAAKKRTLSPSSPYHQKQA